MSLYSLKQALALAKSSQYLIGLPLYGQEASWEIRCITACPAETDLKARFLADYEHYGTTDLTEYIDADTFEVAVLARDRSYPERTRAEELQGFLAKTELKLVA